MILQGLGGTMHCNMLILGELAKDEGLTERGAVIRLVVLARVRGSEICGIAGRW
jgi:hypothetical protein